MNLDFSIAPGWMCDSLRNYNCVIDAHHHKLEHTKWAWIYYNITTKTTGWWADDWYLHPHLPLCCVSESEKWEINSINVAVWHLNVETEFITEDKTREKINCNITNTKNRKKKSKQREININMWSSRLIDSCVRSLIEALIHSVTVKNKNTDAALLRPHPLPLMSPQVFLSQSL